MAGVEPLKRGYGFHPVSLSSSSGRFKGRITLVNFGDIPHSSFIFGVILGKDFYFRLTIFYCRQMRGAQRSLSVKCQYYFRSRNGQKGYVQHRDAGLEQSEHR
jgi:hypothetical protein